MGIRRVLVVDNDPGMARFVSTLLAGEYDVATAEDGLAALCVLEAFKPDLIITELFMPGLSGDKLGSLVRRMDSLKETRLVLLSAHSAGQADCYTDSCFDASIAKGPLDQTAQRLLALLPELEAPRTKALAQDREGTAGGGLDDRLLADRRHQDLTLAHVPEAIIEVARDGRVAYANRAAVALFRLPEHRLLGSGFPSLFAAPDRDRVRRCFEGPARCSTADEGPLSVGTQSVVLNVAPVLDYTDGWFVVTVHDVTERLKATEQSARAQDELERRVRHRTSALTLATKRLGAMIRELRRVEQLLRASLDQKELLLREVHHRVKNNLQIISSLLKLPLRHSRQSPLAGIVQETQNRIRSIWLIHEKLYRSDNLQMVDFSEYMRTLTQNLFESYSVDRKLVGLELDCDTVKLDIDTAVPCGLIVNELVSNCIRHAFPDGARGVVTVSLKQTEYGGCRITVSDNGVGLPGGRQPDGNKTLGMSIVDALVSQIHGEMTWQGNPGTSFAVEFPREGTVSIPQGDAGE